MTAKSYGVSFRDDENCSKVDCGDGCTTVFCDYPKNL